MMNQEQTMDPQELIIEPQEQVDPQDQLIDPLEAMKRRGVCYIPRVPPGMQINRLKELLQPYGIDRVYLVPHKNTENNNINPSKKQQLNKRRSYTEGWIEFLDKRVAKMTALSLNGTPMIQKKRSQFSGDSWQIQYLKDFTWDDLNEKFHYDQRTHQDKVKLEMQQAKKIHDYYQERVEERSRIKKKVKKNDE